MDWIKAIIALNKINGLGPVLIKRILEHFSDDVSLIWKVSFQDLKKIKGISAKHIKGIKQVDWREVQREYLNAVESNINIIPWGSEKYPLHLKNIYDPPMVLYIKGSFEEIDNYSIAIVGTRKASRYGLKQAYSFAKELASKKITVVSGLAYGVDIAAHQGALDGKGRTVAVLGSGLKQIYPHKHINEAKRIINNGALISEFPLYTTPVPYNFPKRNRIISGLVLGVIVIEAGMKSGAVITAYSALQQGRDVFALPGDVDRLQSFGTHKLIQEGAKLITKIDDVLEEILVLQSKINSSPENIINIESSLDEIEKRIYNQLNAIPQSIDFIVDKLDLSPSLISSKLLTMEINGIINMYPGQMYARKQ